MELVDLAKITGIENKSYGEDFLDWLFNFLEAYQIKRVVQVGLNNGYLSSLFLVKMLFSDFEYIGIGKPTKLPPALQYDKDIFHTADEVIWVESISKAAYFIVNGGQCLLVCEEQKQAPIFYWPLLKPQDIMLCNGTPNLSVPSVNKFYDWSLYIK